MKEMTEFIKLSNWEILNNGVIGVIMVYTPEGQKWDISVLPLLNTISEKLLE